MNRIKCDIDGTISVLRDQNSSIKGFKAGGASVNQNFINPKPSILSPSSSVITAGDSDSHEDCDFNDVVLNYINQILMEEDMEEKTCMFQESAALQAAERSFYEVLGEKYPKLPPPDDHPDECYAGTSSSSVVGPGWNCDRTDEHQSVSTNLASPSTSQSSFSSSNGAGNVTDGLVDSPLVKVEKKYETEYPPDRLRGKKNPPRAEDLELEEGRNVKQSAVYTETTVRSELFDIVLLNRGRRCESAVREAFQNGLLNKDTQQNGKARGKKQGGKRDVVVDLTTLLTSCAQAVATNDRKGATELLNQIRRHSSPTGDGTQRLAHYFADGLEARMAGSGARSYMAVAVKPSSAAEILKAYHLFLAVCPFKKLSNFFSNRTIVNVAEKATRLHIVDFGILYGFQWPCLIERLSSRKGGPPKLRITGIELPHPGFRPAERVEETGRRLANYAESFNVPFEFNAIAQKWETIQIEDLKLDKDEVLVVNCQYRFRNLLDETVVVGSPRNTVLNLIRKVNPDVYIQGVVNGHYNAPFFISRFRAALFHFSSLFDMFEATVPREIHERMILEKQIFGWEAMNVIACEGAERIERPETYKQWQVRNLRAGFRQLPLDREIMNLAKDRLNTCYHKDFLVDEDGHWMLQGWKGRIIYALSCWKPAY